MPHARLLDARTPEADWIEALDEIKNAALIGIDCETQDEARHAGLNNYNNANRHVFDHRRTTMTGFSIYCDESTEAWYVNLAHADIENRVPFERARALIDAIPDDAILVAHNSPFEQVMFEQCHGVKFKNLICTLQLAVTHHGPDEYDYQKFANAQLSAFRKFVPDIQRLFAQAEPGSLTGDQRELLGKFIAKESKASHSYNGFVDTIAHGYSLKKLTESRFGVKQQTFKEVLNGKAHMGELTGDEVCAYGADDAYWAVEHYKWMRDDLLRNNPQAFVTFLKTENPMTQVYAECWRDGLQLDLDEVYNRQGLERQAMAAELRKLKGLIKALLPFPVDPNYTLAKKQPAWYGKGLFQDPETGLWQQTSAWKTSGGGNKRTQIEAWANSADSDDDFTQCFQTSNPIGNSWASDSGLKVPSSGKLNLTYYHAMRTIVYDLLGHRIVYSEGEVSSDKEARGKISETFEKAGEDIKLGVMRSLQTMADIEQRIKLFISPYTQLMDPETGRVYPTLSSQLATRRLAGRNPNGMQLSKNGESAYIRGFFLPDNDEHVIVSADWSAIELVLIAELSGDPEFLKVYGQLPYGDLHTGAAADCLSVKTLPGLTEPEFREFKFGRNPNNRELRHIFTNEIMDPAEFYKLARGTAVGKGASFSYPYSGALSTVGNNLGWTSEEMWAAVERYRERFSVMEAWRVGVCQEVSERGFVTLPDNHRRVRLEATAEWANIMKRKFMELSPSAPMQTFADLAIKRIGNRARNQSVNAMIQGTCATLAKRSILAIHRAVADAGLSGLVRFMLPIHDELVFSVHRSVALQFMAIMRKAMCDHPDIVTRVPLDCSMALGRTFRPFNKADPTFSQIELDEAFIIPGVVDKEWEGKKLSDDKIEEVIEWMMAA